MTKNWHKKLKSRIKGYALVTGGASGIGKSLCIQLASSDVPVIICDINEKSGNEAVAEIEKANGKAVFLKLDVTNREAYLASVNSFEAKNGPIDLIINNAGVGTGGEIIDMLPEDWHQIFNINLFGVVNGIDALYPKMIERGRGTIVNVASLAGLYPLPAEAAYAASKYAVVGLTKVLEIEAKSYGVDAVLVCPGKIETPIYQTSDVRGFDKDKALDLWPEGISPEECATIMLKGIANNEKMIVVTSLAKTLWAIERTVPKLSKALGSLYINQMRKHRVK